MFVQFHLCTHQVNIHFPALGTFPQTQNFWICQDKKNKFSSKLGHILIHLKMLTSRCFKHDAVPSNHDVKITPNFSVFWQKTMQQQTHKWIALARVQLQTCPDIWWNDHLRTAGSDTIYSQYPQPVFPFYTHTHTYIRETHNKESILALQLFTEWKLLQSSTILGLGICPHCTSD